MAVVIAYRTILRAAVAAAIPSHTKVLCLRAVPNIRLLSGQAEVLPAVAEHHGLLIVICIMRLEAMVADTPVATAVLAVAEVLDNLARLGTAEPTVRTVRLAIMGREQVKGQLHANSASLRAICTQAAVEAPHVAGALAIMVRDITVVAAAELPSRETVNPV